jgi:hypothetical protein
MSNEDGSPNGSKQEPNPAGSEKGTNPNDLNKATDGEHSGLRKIRQAWQKDPIAIIAAGVSLVAMTFTGLQYRTSVSAMRTDQRAWLISKFVPNLPLTDGQPFDQTVNITNSGKTSAKDAQGRLVSGLYRATDTINFDYRHGTRVEAGLLQPNDSYPVPSRLLRRDLPEGTAIDQAQVIISPDIRTAIGTNTLFIVTYGRITYDDIFGVEHFINFCGFGPRNTFTFTSFAMQCLTYNDAD